MGQYLAFVLQGMLVLEIPLMVEDRSPECTFENLNANVVSHHGMPNAENGPTVILDDHDVETVKVVATVEKGEYRPMEPIRVSVQARNVSNRQLLMPGRSGATPEAYYRIFRVRVLDDRNSPVPTTRFHDLNVRFKNLPIGGSNGSAGVNLAPEESRKGEVIANLVYDMTAPGVYSILIEFETIDPAAPAGAPNSRVARSAPIRVQVLEEPPGLPFITSEEGPEKR